MKRISKPFQHVLTRVGHDVLHRALLRLRLEGGEDCPLRAVGAGVPVGRVGPAPRVEVLARVPGGVVAGRAVGALDICFRNCLLFWILEKDFEWYLTHIPSL